MRNISEEDAVMTVGEVIREKRKALGLTQEQTAQRLGVTAPAVNKWERGSTFPDITILPALARLLETDVNTLLCFQKELSDEEIAQICSRVVAAMEAEGLEQAFDMAEQKVQEYPNSGKLLHMMASVVQGMILMSGQNGAREKYEDRIYAWYERVIELNGDERSKYAAAYMLASKYMQEDKYEKAQKMLDLLPEQGADKRILTARILLKQDKPGEAARVLEHKLVYMINELMSVLSQLMETACREGANERAEHIASVGAQTAILYDQWGYSSLILPMELAVNNRDTEKSITYIREMFRRLREPQHMSESLLFSHIYGDRQSGKTVDDALGDYVERIIPTLIEEIKTNDDYAFLRENKEFQELMEQMM